MKTLILLIAVLFFVSCQKEDEPKPIEPRSLIVTNGITQRLYSKYNTPTFTESVSILYIGADRKYVRTDNFPVSYASVQNITNYQVTSTVLEDNVVSVIIIVRFYYSHNMVSFINYESKDITIHEGINRYTITDGDLRDQ